MTPIALTILIFAIMLVLMAVRTPIAISMFVAGTVGYILQAGWLPLANFLNAQAYARFASYDLSVIPLFILMGQFATQGGISKALFEFTAALVGRLRGGLAMAIGVRIAISTNISTIMETARVRPVMRSPHGGPAARRSRTGPA